MHIDAPTTTSEVPLIGGHFPLEYLGITMYTPSRVGFVDKISSYMFNPSKKQIVQRTEKSLKLTKKPQMVITQEVPVIENTNKEPKSLASVSIEIVMAMKYNINKILREMDHANERSI